MSRTKYPPTKLEDTRSYLQIYMEKIRGLREQIKNHELGEALMPKMELALARAEVELFIRNTNLPY